MYIKAQSERGHSGRGMRSEGDGANKAHRAHHCSARLTERPFLFLVDLFYVPRLLLQPSFLPLVGRHTHVMSITHSHTTLSGRYSASRSHCPSSVPSQLNISSHSVDSVLSPTESGVLRAVPGSSSESQDSSAQRIRLAERRPRPDPAIKGDT